MPCGHGGICMNCCIDLIKTNKHCFLCRDKIQEFALIGNEGGDAKRIKKVFIF